MITEDYVSFETAKLLKEKGFDWDCQYCYIDEDGSEKEQLEVPTGYDAEIDSPTLQMAMKWLREVHNLFIEIYVDTADMYYDASIYGLNNERKKKVKEFPTYEQATEAAIKYCLENLILSYDTGRKTTTT